MRTRAKAFKYLVILCDESTNRKSYEETLKYATRALSMACSRTELKVLKMVLETASKNLNERRRSLSYLFTRSSHNMDTSVSVLEQLQELVGKIESRIEVVGKRRASVVDQSASVTIEGDDKSPVAERVAVSLGRSIVEKNRDTSGKLDWEPAYAAKKQQDKRNSCVVS